MSRPLRVAIADDHPFYRRGLARSLRASGIDVVAEAPNGEAAIRAVKETAPDVMVMDLNMPGVSGLEATLRLAEQGARTPVLVLSVSAVEADVTAALLAGACGYVLKDRPVEELVAAIRSAAAGASQISPEVAMRLLRGLCAPPGPTVDLTGVPFTPAELELLRLLAGAKDDEEIAGTLGLALGAVQAHAAGILTTLLETRDDRVRAALRGASART